jgi:hypothetical protein
MNDKRDTLLIAVILITLTFALMTLHYLVFQDVHHLWIFFLGDLAFIPVEILIVTIVIERLLESRDRRQKMEKLNMVIGAFFSTMGTPLLTRFSRSDPKVDALHEELVVTEGWSDTDFLRVTNFIRSHECTIPPGSLDLQDLKEFLLFHEEFLLRLLENPMILEHESFAELTQALFHLTEELRSRPILTGLPETDLQHLSGDIRRTYSLLTLEWVAYMQHLKNLYPYLFSLAMRKNPFDTDASVIVRK